MTGAILLIMVTFTSVSFGRASRDSLAQEDFMALNNRKRRATGLGIWLNN